MMFILSSLGVVDAICVLIVFVLTQWHDAHPFFLCAHNAFHVLIIMVS
jgi:hypothetical protein